MCCDRGPSCDAGNSGGQGHQVSSNIAQGAVSGGGEDSDLHRIEASDAGTEG